MGLFGHSQHTVTRADKISNFSVNTAEYGAPVMEILGTTRISGNVIYYDDFTAHEHAETVETGKGGGGSTNTNITYTYSVAIIIGLCEGPIYNIGRVWKNKDLLYYPADQLQLTLFKGTANQQPWAYVVGKHPEKAMAYQNLAYMAGVVDLGDSAGLPSYNFEVKGKLLSTGDGIDVNPLDYIQYVLSKVGQGGVEIKGAANFQSFCANADLLISTPSDATGTEEAQKIVNEIAELCGAYIFASNDTYKIVPLADRPIGGWTPDKTIRYDLTTDDFKPQNGSCVTWSRKDTSEQYNRWTVEFLNRASGYEKESVTYEDVADIAERGVKQAPTINARYIYTKDRAVKIAEAAARRSKVGRNQYTFKLDWAFCRLEPGDLVRITDEASGISNQPVMITRVQEDEKGLLTFTAISWFTANYGAAEYDVHDVDRPFIDFNVPPGNVAPPVIFQPPADLTQNGLEVWLASKGLTSNWGGCIVYVSDDNEHYRRAGQIANNARIGTLANGLTESGTSLEVAINGTMLSGTLQDAQRGNTLMWIDGECLSYQTATLLPNGHYRLDSLIRGQYNTSAAAHSSGSTLVRCDERLLKVPFYKEDIGKKLWIKFCSYNIFGGNEQSLSDVQAYEYTLQPYYIPPVKNITAYNRYRQLADGVSRYDIVVKWTPPDLQSYLEGQVWYKTDHAQVNQIAMADLATAEGILLDDLAYQGSWIYGGSGKNEVVIPQAVVGDTYRIAVCTKDEWGVATSPDAAPQVTIKVAIKTTTPNTPADFALSFGRTAHATWKEVINADIMFYEIRKDDHPGVESANLLARTNNFNADLPLTERRGTLYLYAKSAIGKYSAPAILQYYKPVPPTPELPQVKEFLGGFSLLAGEIPAGCNGMRVYIDAAGQESGHFVFDTVNNAFTHNGDPGIYDCQVAYTDLFGEGGKSGEVRAVINILVTQDMIDEEAISLEKCDAAVQRALERGEGSYEDIVQLVRAMNDIGDDEHYTALVQLADAMEMRVRSGEIISKINMSPETITIDGKYVHITGNTVIDNNLITKGMIQSNAVTADKIDVNSLSAISAVIGLLRTATSGSRMEIESNQLRVYDANNVLRVRLGVW
jgi:hypothetical protein